MHGVEEDLIPVSFLYGDARMHDDDPVCYRGGPPYIMGDEEDRAIMGLASPEQREYG